MNYFYFFLIIGSVIVYLILRFDKHQRRKQSSLLKQTTDVQPLLLMQSMGRKLDQLNRALTHQTAQDHIEDRLKNITADYNSGRINMQTYSNQLTELLRLVEVKA